MPSNPTPMIVTDDETSEQWTVAEVVQRIHSGELRTEDLRPQLRQQCVDHLTLDGFTNSEIAQLMGINERTIRRDRAEIRRDGAMTPSLTLGDEMMGEFQRITLASIQRLVRMARDPDAPPYARLWAEEAIVRNYQRLLDTAHRLQYIATGSSRIDHLFRTDPDEQRRHRESMAALLKF